MQQNSSTIYNTLNQEKAAETHAHDEYLQTFKHAKDIRDQLNSEQNIITWKKQNIPKVKISLASTRSSMGQYNNDFRREKAQYHHYGGSYTPNYGLNKKFVFQHKANQDQGSPIKYTPLEQTRIANTPMNLGYSQSQRSSELWNRNGQPDLERPRRVVADTANRTFLNTSIAK